MTTKAKKQSKDSLTSAKQEQTPKTTRPETSSRREKKPTDEGLSMGGRKFDAFPDRIDIRDWLYQPSLAPLPDQVINCDSVPLPILNQGQEGACTGYALAAVINFRLAARNIRRLVSPRMLYEMARR